MAKFTDLISNLVNSQAPDFVLEQHPKFLEFVKQYYTFMEAAELSVTSVQTTDGIILETDTTLENELLLDGSKLTSQRTQEDAGDKILLESSTYGKFTRGETITGSTSNATATVLTEDLSNGKLYISSQNKFKDGETITGNSSSASAVINNYKPNPVSTIQQLLEFRDPDKVISNFLTKFRNEFLNTLPETLFSEIDKRKLIKNIKSLYRAKGTARGHEIFFKMLFGLNSETIYPKEQMLRASDGQWNIKKILRCIATTGQTENLIGRTITGQSSGATAIIENVFKFQIGSSEVSECILNEDTITGTFTAGEEIRGTQSDTSTEFIKATVSALPSTSTISNDGALYSTGDVITVTGGGEAASIQVGDVGSGGITSFVIDAGGSGYAIGDDINFTNTGAGGGSAEAKVSVVNGGFTQEESTSTVDDHIVLEDETVRGDPYTGNKIVQESGSGSEDITDIRIINSGSNYTSLPTVAVSTDSGGSGASVFAFGDQVGRVQSINKIDPGINYQDSPSPPSLTFLTKILVTDISGTFTENETITGVDSSSTAITATFKSLDTDTQIMTLSSASGTFAVDTTLTGGTSGKTAVVKIVDTATATTTVATVIDTDGSYLNEDGHISELTMKVQDSLYYQDFSYVIKVGRSINDWRDSFKKTMHGAGFYFTGQVDSVNRINAQLKSITGINSSISYDGPALVINTLFSTILGSRLGTETDGTSVRANKNLGVGADLNDSTSEHFTANTRDRTLTQRITLKLGEYKEFPVAIRNNSTKFGIPVAGPTFKSLGKFMLGGNFSNRTNISSINALRLGGTFNTSVNGVASRISDFTFKLKTNYAIPSEIGLLQEDTFDENQTFFDATDVTFDAG